MQLDMEVCAYTHHCAKWASAPGQPQEYQYYQNKRVTSCRKEGQQFSEIGQAELQL